MHQTVPDSELMQIQNPYDTIPATAERQISRIGEIPPLLIFREPKYTTPRTSVRSSGRRRSAPPSMTMPFFRIINRPVARMMPIIQGLIPRSTACTKAFFNAVFKTAVTSRMMRNDGSTTASVATTDPATATRPCRR